MIRALLIALITSLAYLAPASADQTVPMNFFGINIGLDPTVAGNRPPNLVTNIRLFPGDCNAVADSTFWKFLETANGVFNWSNSDCMLGAVNGWGLDSIVVLTNPATWVASPVTTFVMSSGAQQSAYSGFVAAFAAKYPTFPKYVGLPNEFDIPSSYSGAIPAANMVTASLDAYPRLSPAHTVLGASVAPTNGINLLAPNPASGWWPFEQYLIGCAAASPSKCFDLVNWHFYLNSVFMNNSTPAVKWAPELVLNGARQEDAIRTARGFSAYSSVADEGYCGNPGTPDFNSDTDKWAGDQAKCALMLSAFSPQLKFVDWFSHGTNCGDQKSCGNTQGAVQGNNNTGSALRYAMMMSLGSVWKGSPLYGDYISRTRNGSNAIRSQGDGAGATLGRVSGTGAGCASSRAGTAGGALPSNWSASNPAPAAGASVVVDSIDATNHTIGIELCGAITTNGAGTAIFALAFDNPGAAAATGQTWHFDYCQNMVAGSMSGVQYVQPTIVENTSGGGFLALTNDASMLPQPNTNLCHSIRTVLSGGGTVARAEPVENTIVWYNGNGTTGSIPFDITRVYSDVYEDQGTIWSGSFTRAATGCSYTVAWTDDGLPQTFTTAKTSAGNLSGAWGPVTGGSVVLTDAPTFLRSCP